MKVLRVLLVDDDTAFLDFADEVLTGERYSVTMVSDFKSASSALDSFKGKIVILSELILNGESALPFLKESIRKYPHVPFTLLARAPSLESVIEVLKQGAYDFLRKPVAPDILCRSVARSVEKLNLVLEGEAQESETRRLLERSRSDLKKSKSISDFKGFLISATAHDFNSALSVLDGYHHFLRERCKSCEKPAVENLLEQTMRSITRLRSLSATLLDSEAAEKGELILDIREIVLHHLLKESISFYQPIADQKQIALALEDGIPAVTVRGDSDRIMQVLDNLLFNAIKNTPSQGEIRVGAKPEEGGNVTVWVRDNGIGIPEKIQKKIFQRPVWVSSELGNERLGLGLVICRTLIEAQNGKIWMEANPGRGTVVFFSLPV